MMLAALYGLLTGVALCLTFGTVFFVLIQNSIDNGYRSGIEIALGVVVTDTFFVFCAVFGTSFLPKIAHFDQWTGGVGAILLLLLGTMNMVRGTPKVAYPKTKLGSFVYYFGTGALLNALNPINFFSWVSIAAYLKTNTTFNLGQTVVFFGSSLLGVLLAESALAYYAHKLKGILKPSTIEKVNKVSGAIFVALALNIIYKTFGS